MKTLAALFALLSFAVSSHALDFGVQTGGTPYDRYMGPVKAVLSNLSETAPTMDTVQKLMRQGRGFRYSFDEPYIAARPEVTAAKQAGDCKAKALWLCNQLGDDNCRFVVGKAHEGAKLSHAWVLWREHTSGRWYILDCTNYSSPIAADTVSNRDYVPLYSWTKSGVYHHASTMSGVAAVAGKRNAPVAATASERKPKA